MPDPTIEALFEQYDAIIDEMPETFDSHQFILALAQRHQKLYIEALYAYREAADPFKTAHATIVMQLKKVEGLVLLPDLVSSKNIFGYHTSCGQWQKA